MLQQFEIGDQVRLLCAVQGYAESSRGIVARVNRKFTMGPVISYFVRMARGLELTVYPDELAAEPKDVPQKSFRSGKATARLRRD